MFLLFPFPRPEPTRSLDSIQHHSTSQPRQGSVTVQPCFTLGTTCIQHKRNPRQQASASGCTKYLRSKIPKYSGVSKVTLSRSRSFSTPNLTHEQPQYFSCFFCFWICGGKNVWSEEMHSEPVISAVTDLPKSTVRKRSVG